MNDYKKRFSIKDDLLQSLENSYAILKGVIESPQNIVIFALDCRYRYLAFNQSHHQTMKQIRGVDIALGNSMLDYLKNSDDRLKAKTNFDRALSGESFTLEEEYGDMVVERRYCENIYNPIIDKNDNIIGLTLFLIDITDRQNAEKKLNKTTYALGERLKELNCLYRISELINNENTTTEEVLQDLADIIPLSWQYPEITCAQIKIGDQSYKSDNFKETEWFQSQKIIISEMMAGEVKVFYCEEKPEIDEGPFCKEERALINVIAERIGNIIKRKKAEDERRQLQARLQQAQKMEAIGTLAGGIAHDFNNILAAILGYTEMARDNCQPGSTVTRDLSKVLKAGNRAKDLVQQILAFSRQGETKSIPLQPAIIVNEAITMLRPSIPTTIEISQNIADTTGFIFADPTQIHQILINLCTNAFHAMEETGGKLDISLKEVTLSKEDLVREPNVEDGAFIRLSICDSGPGIAPAIKNKIFDPYFTTKETGKGTGMGLSIVHGIAKSYGGFISLYSELGEGTAFHVFLPVIEKKALPEIESFEQNPVGRERILFIDDEEILAEMGKDMLEMLGYHVTVRNSSQAALKTFQNQPDQFDLIITDQTMPDMTGADLARRMLQIRPDMPIILCTGYSSIISAEEARSMGIREFVLKPITMNNIAVLIRKVLDNA